jgi:menaquinone-9 beta-reductase
MAARADCDLLIIGGGLAGSVLGAAMAGVGHRVIIIEKETEFRDRVRGEVLLPWGSLEARRLGVHDFLLETCASKVLCEIFMLGGEMHEPRDYTSTTPEGTSALSFYHPEMQEQLLRRAQVCGAEVRRGTAITAINPGPRPSADIASAEGKQVIEARLIVAADGRESQVASLLEFDRERDEPELFTGGLQMTGDLDIEHALYFSLSTPGGLGSILVSNRPGNYRAYLLHHKDALQRRLSGARDYAAVKQQFAAIGWNKDWLAELEPHGTFATFDGAHRWVRHPVRGNCILIGDAAGASDPVWGNGLSRTLRDVRLLRDRLLSDADWRRAANAYAEDHDDFFFRLRRVERLCAKLYFGVGPEAETRRERASALLAKRPELRPDMAGLGPEARCDDESERVLLH